MWAISYLATMLMLIVVVVVVVADVVVTIFRLPFRVLLNSLVSRTMLAAPCKMQVKSYWTDQLK